MSMGATQTIPDAVSTGLVAAVRAGSATGARGSYNVFRRLDAPELRCAVPDDRAVPSFIEGTGWAFERRLDGSAPVPKGFDPRAADLVAGWNGFYLFESWARDEAR